MPEFTVEQLFEALNESGIKLKSAKVTVLGLSYKPNVADDRESPSYKLIKILKDKGANLAIFDPYFLEKSTVTTLKEAIKKADAIIVATDHKEFKKLLPKNLTSKVFIDGKNAFDRTLFKNTKIVYRGIGQ